MGKIKNNKNRRPEANDIVNEDIKDKELLVIGLEGEQLGVLSRRDALQVAYDQDLDLLLVSANANPPVARILDYGRYHFEDLKKKREAKRNQSVTEVKPLRLSPVIDQHDFETKLKKSREWLEDGLKVRIDMRFRGRMITRQEIGREVIERFTQQISDIADVSKPAKLEGNTLSVVYSPKKGK